MTRIQIETESAKAHGTIFPKSSVPMVSILLTAALIAAVIVIPAGSADPPGFSVLKYFSNLGIAFPKINFSPLPDLNLPEWITYTFIGIMFLAFSDRALFGIFNKERK